MSGLVEHVTRWENAQWEAVLNEEPRCESDFHNDPGPFDAHGGPATHWQSGPCVHAYGLRCAPHVANIRRHGGACCDLCNIDADLSEMTFVEL